MDPDLELNLGVLRCDAVCLGSAYERTARKADKTAAWQNVVVPLTPGQKQERWRDSEPKY